MSSGLIPIMGFPLVCSYDLHEPTTEQVASRVSRAVNSPRPASYRGVSQFRDLIRSAQTLNVETGDTSHAERRRYASLDFQVLGNSPLAGTGISVERS